MSYQSLSEKLSQVSHLIAIAKADGFVNLAEVSYIFWTAQRLGLSELELKRLFEKGAPLEVPITTPERVDVFHTCITILAIDGQVVERELQTCALIGSDLRLDRFSVKRVLDCMLQGNGSLLTIEELKVHFKI